jgi:hypothetical protein
MRPLPNIVEVFARYDVDIPRSTSNLFPSFFQNGAAGNAF